LSETFKGAVIELDCDEVEFDLNELSQARTLREVLAQPLAAKRNSLIPLSEVP
jgi:hypothetical protein